EGYLGRPDLTAQRFVRGPDGERAYKSGDLVCFDEDGQLVFLGRVDSEIKLSGYRIAPAEVERCLHRHPDVTACVVSAVRRGTTQLLVAQVEVHSSVDAKALTAFLGGRLPPAMVPTRWHLYSHLPRTTNGKLDRQVLVELLLVNSEDTSVDAPEARSEKSLTSPSKEVSVGHTALVASILQVFRDVLGCQQINAED